MEWEPPEDDGLGGYLKWYLDGTFLYGIRGENLELTGTEIPSEPMYLLMNTAVASSWGFPKPCPDGCDCECYECGNPDCLCGLPDGFCDNFPATFEVDYVRVYQAKDESKHVLGCSTEKRPTARFIMGHKKDYMNTEEGQTEPLLSVRRGGGYCQQNSNCGYPEKGECSGNRCVCQDGFTGPKCLSPDGFDDNPPPPPEIHFEQMTLSPTMLSMLTTAVVVFILFVCIIVLKRRKQVVASYDQLLDTSNTANRLDPEDIARFMTNNQTSRDASAYEQGSYQKGAGVNNDQKTVTYCMIDGRLLDDQRT